MFHRSAAVGDALSDQVERPAAERLGVQEDARVRLGREAEELRPGHVGDAVRVRLAAVAGTVEDAVDHEGAVDHVGGVAQLTTGPAGVDDVHGDREGPDAAVHARVGVGVRAGDDERGLGPPAGR